MSDKAHSANRARTARPALVIDGEATVLSRRATSPGASQPADAGPPVESLEPASDFGRRPSRRRPPAPDLVFQGAGRRPADRLAPVSRRRPGLSVFSAAADLGGAAGDRRVAGFAGALAILALPFLVISAPIGPAVATPGAEALVLEDLVTSILPRGAGAVLSVEGRIRNVSGRAAAVPALRIALAETGGGRRSKALLTGVSRLDAGRALRFHSSVAVAKDTNGDVEVGFLAAPHPSRKTSVE